ncbi:hypothetical protein BANRA_00009 [Acinetobacter baumannii]|nr:hypothetical protein BANRA_00009 [Acinetobacter baumannii]
MTYWVSSDKGICSVRFVDHSENIQEIVKQYFPKAQLKITPIWHQQIAQWFRQDFSEHLQQKLPLNLAGISATSMGGTAYYSRRAVTNLSRYC